MTGYKLPDTITAAELIDELRKTLKDRLHAYDEICDLARRKISGEIDHVLACLDILDKKAQDPETPFTRKRILRLRKLIVKPTRSAGYRSRFKRLSDIERNLNKIEKQIIEILGDSRR